MRRLIYEVNESFRMAFAQIRSNKMRSALTALGVVIGILAVTLMGTAINGIDKGFDRSLSMIGYDVLYVQKWPWTGGNEWWKYRNRRKIKTEYADEIKHIVSETPKTEIALAVPQGVTFRSVKRNENKINSIEGRRSRSIGT